MTSTDRPPQITFSFGENWKNFLFTVSEESIRGAMRDIESWVGTEGGAGGVAGKRVVDVGCGSGIHSLCYFRLGAAELVSFDYDPKSVEATRSLWEKAGRPAHWRVEHGSALDGAWVDSLGTFDLVYSWGVLHHTGRMWEAIGNACRLARPGGLLWLSLYAKGPHYAADLALKERYNKAGRLGKWMMERRWIAGLMYRRLRSGQNPFAWNQKQIRGMDTYHDIVDWLGGLPYEVVTVGEVQDFLGSRGFAVDRVEEVAEGGCHIFLFRKNS